MIDGFQFSVGDRVVVEVTGTVKVVQESEYGKKYIVQPDNPHAASVHASPEYVFPEDDDNEPAGAEVIRFPKPPLPEDLAHYCDGAAA